MSAGSSVTQHRRRDEEAHTHTKPPPILLPRFRDWFLSVVFFLSPFKLFFFSLSLPIFFFASFSWRRQSLRLGGSSLQPAASFPRLSQSFLHLSSSAVARELDLALASATQAETYNVVCANFRLYTQVSPIKTLLQCKNPSALLVYSS